MDNKTPEETLIADLAKGIKLKLPAAVHRYLAMRTDFDIRAWERSPATFENKWRLAVQLMEGTVKDKDIISVLNGGVLYPMGGKDPVFCQKCLREMSQIGGIFLCRHCTKEQPLYQACARTQ